MKIKIDPSQLTQKPLPEDDYSGVIVKKLDNRVSAKGNVGTGFQIEVNEGEYTNRKVIGNITVTESSLWKANQLHKAVTGEDLPEQEYESEGEFLDFLSEAIMGQGVRFRVKHQTGNDGETRADLTYLSE